MYEDGKYRRNPDVSWRTIEGQAVLVDNRKSEILVANEVATLIWERLDQGLESVVRNIREQFDVGEDEARRDALDFLDQMIAAGALLPA